MQITAGVHIKEQHAVHNGVTFTKSFRPKARLAGQIYIKYEKRKRKSVTNVYVRRTYEWDEYAVGGGENRLVRIMALLEITCPEVLFNC